MYKNELSSIITPKRIFWMHISKFKRWCVQYSRVPVTWTRNKIVTDETELWSLTEVEL